MVMKLVAVCAILGFVASNPIDLGKAKPCHHPSYNVFKTCFSEFEKCIIAAKVGVDCPTVMKYCAVAPSTCQSNCFIQGFMVIKSAYTKSLNESGFEDIAEKIQAFGKKCRKPTGLDVSCIRTLVGETKTLLDNYPKDKISDPKFVAFKAKFDLLVLCESTNPTNDGKVAICSRKMIDEVLHFTHLATIGKISINYPQGIGMGVYNYLACKKSDQDQAKSDQDQAIVCAKQQIGNIRKLIDDNKCDQTKA